MTDSTPFTSVGPLESTAAALNAMVLQMGLYAEMAKTQAQGQLTPELRVLFATVVAATSEPAEA
jgi:hypothetical protein